MYLNTGFRIGSKRALYGREMPLSCRVDLTTTKVSHPDFVYAGTSSLKGLRLLIHPASIAVVLNDCHNGDIALSPLQYVLMAAKLPPFSLEYASSLRKFNVIDAIIAFAKVSSMIVAAA